MRAMPLPAGQVLSQACCMPPGHRPRRQFRQPQNRRRRAAGRGTASMRRLDPDRTAPFSVANARMWHLHGFQSAGYQRANFGRSDSGCRPINLITVSPGRPMPTLPIWSNPPVQMLAVGTLAATGVIEYFPILPVAFRVRLRSGPDKHALWRVHMTLLLLIVAATAALLDGCRLLLVAACDRCGPCAVPSPHYNHRFHS